jgi:hypothetical protein
MACVKCQFGTLVRWCKRRVSFQEAFLLPTQGEVKKADM